ncbi:MAG: tetratricopeptide repeat protein [Actinomycetota bacterium]
MSFDKTKAMRTAERFLSQGKIRAAISEYKRIVEYDQKDYSTLNILGDLYVKGNDENEAVNCYTKVAEHYSKQGFAQKAIAIYNKISRLQPNSADVSAKLAKLYQLKGSFAEARSHYVALAEQYQRKGQKGEALEIWKQIAQLDPTNTEVYLKIAESCWQDGNKEEAAKAFTEAGIRLSIQNQLESALTAFSRALEIRQYDLNALNGFVNTQVKLGFADEAAKTLEGILEKQPYNREILYLLVDCYIDMNNPVEAEKAVIRLVEQEPANYPKFLELVEIYVKNEDLESAVRILSMSSEHLLVGGKSEEFLKWTNEILARNPEQVDALRLLVRYYGWQRDESELRKSLERLAEIARLKDSVDDERYALSQLVMIMPHEVSYAKRLQELVYEFGGEIPVVAEESVSEFNADDSEVPTFDSYSVLDNEETNGQPEQFENYGEYPSEIGLDETEAAFVYDDGALNGNGSSNGKGKFVIETFEPESIKVVETNLSDGSAPALKPSDELRLGQELESIEFYITQGYQDLAEKTLSALEAEFGARPEIAGLRAQIVKTSPPELVEKTTPQVEVLEAETLTESVEEIKVEENQIPPAFNYLNDFRNDLGFEESEVVDEGDYETHYHMAIAYKEMGLMEESIREFQDAVNLVRADDGTRRFFQCCNLIGICFMEQGMPNLALMWYRRALETPNLNNEEKQALLYETANAYEIGGETPKAVEYFEQIYAVNVDYRDVSTRLENLREHNMAM